MIDLDRYTSPRLSPSQTRGKERVRLILFTALELFRDKGIDQVTTNDIARAAHIPIGSIYRYFQNKEEVILTIAEIQIQEVVELFTAIAQTPELPGWSWQHLSEKIVDTWAEHVRQNDSFAFIYFLRSNQRLHDLAAERWSSIRHIYGEILNRRHPGFPKEKLSLYVQLTWSAVEMSAMGDKELAHEAVAIFAAHLEKHYA